jgi:hypothetical protein
MKIKENVKVYGSLHKSQAGINPGANQISDHQQSWGYEEGPSKGPGPSLLVAADFYDII